MDQARIGKFIAEMRKAKRLTQRQLADALAISDKTVSKWECGKGLPEVSLMLPLCEALEITVNDLLSGERVSGTDYQRKAEENMVDLVRKNQENRRRLALSAVCAGITAVAVGALIVIASFFELPTGARIALIALAIATAAAGTGAAAALDFRAGVYECPHCKARFVPTLREYVRGVHTLTRRRLTCPKCGQTGMCRRRIAG